MNDWITTFLLRGWSEHSWELGNSQLKISQWFLVSFKIKKKNYHVLILTMSYLVNLPTKFHVPTYWNRTRISSQANENCEHRISLLVIVSFSSTHYPLRLQSYFSKETSCSNFATKLYITVGWKSLPYSLTTAMFIFAVEVGTMTILTVM